MRRPALQNKQIGVYEWLSGPEKFSGLSRNELQASVWKKKKHLYTAVLKKVVKKISA